MLFVETAIVTLSGGTVPSVIGAPRRATLRVSSDGKVYQRLGDGAFTQISSVTDWIRPASVAPLDYEVRFTNLAGDSITAPMVEDAWRAISLGDTDFVLGDGAGLFTTFDIEIRKGSSGSSIASGEYNLDTGT
jgi:hypothetical protein